MLFEVTFALCGIVGIFNYSSEAPSVNRKELLKIRDHMSPRGPDDAGSWLSDNKPVGLAHRRLSIIDLSEAAAQPMLDPGTGNRIVFNGEIYNYQCLRDELEREDQRFQSASDTEVLLKLYSEHGPDMVHKLRGMYAFAIWDELKKGVFLARDPFGIKPLYLADDGKTLRFASQVKALLAGGCIDTSLEPAGHVGFFLWGYVPEPFTLYRGINALPAGTHLWIDTDGSKEQKQFFNVTEELSSSHKRDSLTPADAHNLLRDALLDSVRHHLIADVPVGVFLSAGLDSATVAALAKETEAKDITTVTLGFQEFAGTQDDETLLAETIAERYGTKHQTVWVRKDDFESELASLLDSMDQPSIDGVNSFFVCKAAKTAGLKAALSGLGGDELFGGYSSFRDIPRLVKLVKPFAGIPSIGRVFRHVTAPLLKHITSPKYAGILEYGGSCAEAYFLRYGLYMPWELSEVLDPDIVETGWKDLQTVPALRQVSDGLSEYRTQICALETVWYMRNQLLRDADWASMAHSLEVRVPLVDIELFRTVIQLTQAGHTPSKQNMAAAPKRVLPSSILQRQKTGFSIPVTNWLTSATDSNGKAQRGLRGWAKTLYDVQIARSF